MMANGRFERWKDVDKNIVCRRVAIYQIHCTITTGIKVKVTFNRLRQYPLFGLSLAFLAGIIFARQFPQSAFVWLGISGTFFILVTLLYIFADRLRFQRVSPTNLLLIGIALVTFFMGAARFQANLPLIDAFHVAWYNDREYDVQVTGILVEPPDYRDTYTNLRIKVNAIDTGSGDLPVEGLLLARVFPNVTYKYGESLRIRGRLLTPPENEDFSYREYLARQGIHSYMMDTAVTLLPGNQGNPIKRAIYGLKDKALANIYQIFPDPEASLMAGILLGVDTGLPEDLQKAFADTGTAHIIAISGFNIAIIAALFIAIFSRLLGQTYGSILAIIGVAFYTFLVGADAAVLRAAIMGTLSLLARQLGRRNDGLNALFITAAAMALFDPIVPWDIGFQLSFFATLGLVVYAEASQNWAIRMIGRFTSPGNAQRIAALLSEYFLITLVVQLTTLPIMAYHFQRISLVSLIANPFILPVQPAVMVFGGIAVILSLVWLPLGGGAAFIAWPFAAYTIRIVEIFSKAPNGVLVLGNFSLLLALLFYIALLGWTFTRQQIKSFFSTQQDFLTTVPVTIALSGLIVLSALLWRAVFTLPDGRLHLIFLDVGSADAILIQTPSGRNILINGGPSASLLSNGLGRRLSPFNRRLDWLVVASTQENQLSGLPRVVERIPPGSVLWAGNLEASYAARTLDAWVTEQSIPTTRAEIGAELHLGQGVVLRVLDANPRGAVLLVEWESFRALLPVGLNFDALESLDNGKEIGQVSLLLLSESGYAPLSPPEWILNLNPQSIVLNVAAGDKDGLPDEETLETIEDFPLFRTDQNGWIEAITDGRQVWFRIEKLFPAPSSQVTLEAQTPTGEQ